MQKSIYTMLFILLASFGFSQEKDNLGTEVVNVVKPYTPEIGDAFKIKSTPTLNDSVNTAKKKVTYGIFSVPVASTFVPEAGQAAEVEKEERVKLYDSYATLGFGTYTSALAEFYTNFELDRDKNLGLYLNHNSSQGGIPDAIVDDFFYDTRLNAKFSSYDRDIDWNAELDLDHEVYNWYGVDDAFSSTEDIYSQIDPTHSFIGVGLSGGVELPDAIIEKATARVRFFSDSYESSEFRAVVMPKAGFSIGDEMLNLDLKMDYVTGSFDRNYSNSQPLEYGTLITSLSPSLQVLRDDLTLNLGLTGALAMDSQSSESTVKVYPNITASYRVADELLIAYAGLEGQLMQNSYEQFVSENPFVSPTLAGISPTDESYNFYLGAKGKLTSTLGYNLRGGYSAENNKALFKANPRFEDSDGNLGNENYQYGNSFNVVYDDVKILNFFGELNFDLNTNLKLRLNGEVFSYSTDSQAEAWNLPTAKASFFADYQIDENWFAGVTLYMMSERKDVDDITGPFIMPQPATVTIDGFFDANAHAGYRINEQLSIFARVNNALGNNYQRWFNYPVQGFQALAGATYKFDF
ncbi:MAG: TonB-dependent receptor [Leeuwenhoekiella sp.]